MSSVNFQDYSLQISKALDKKAFRFLQEAAFAVQKRAITNTPADEDKGELRGSWGTHLDKEAGMAMVGSNLESAFWNEYGTGSYAEHGDGRKGWWVYIEGRDGKSSTPSKSYQTEAEAQDAADFLRRVKGLPAVVSNGKPKKKTLFNAFTASKRNIIAIAKDVYGEDW